MSTEETREQNNVDNLADDLMEDQPVQIPINTDTEQPALQEQIDILKDKYLRLQAEFDNFRKRTQKESDQARKYQALNLIRDLLPVVDNLQRALAAAETSDQIADLVAGVQMVSNQILEVLGRYHAKPIIAVGQPFDPNLHEAIQQLPDPNVPAQNISQEIEQGYLLHDRVIRPSKVIVSSGPPDAAAESE